MRGVRQVNQEVAAAAESKSSDAFALLCSPCALLPPRQKSSPVLLSTASAPPARPYVLVDDRHDAVGKQLRERVARVYVLRAVGQVVERQQHLRAREAERLQEVLVVAHEVHLADGRERLLLRDLGRPRREPEALAADADRAGRHEDDEVAVGVEALDDLADARERREVERAVRLVDERARADLDHDDLLVAMERGLDARLALDARHGRAPACLLCCSSVRAWGMQRHQCGDQHQ